jgi:hypothetical protein
VQSVRQGIFTLSGLSLPFSTSKKERRCLVIDFSKFSTTEEKLIVQHFDVVNKSLTQKQICTALDLKERWVRETLKVVTKWISNKLQK